MTTVTLEQSPILFTFSPKGMTKGYDYTYAMHWQEYFKSWLKVMEDFEINPELNCNGNLHYHGFYVLKNLRSYEYMWFHKILPKLKYNGLWRCEYVKEDLQKALVYCRKDRVIMEQLLKVRPLPLTPELYRLEKDKYKDKQNKSNIKDKQDIDSTEQLSHPSNLLDYGFENKPEVL